MAWEVRKLGDVCEFENGDRGKNYPSRSKFIESGFLFVNAGHLNDYRIALDRINYISKGNYDLLSRGKFTEGDILFCLRGSLGKFAVVNKGLYGAIASSLVIVRPKEKITSDFLAYYFQSSLCEQMIEKFKGGTAQPNLGAKDLSRFEIPLPLLPEQKSIVAILDKAFENITKAKENAEKNLKNAKEIFNSYLHSVFENKGEEWEEEKLGEILNIKRGGSPRPIQKYLTSDANGINWIKIGDTKEVDKYIFKTHQKIKPEGLKKSRLVNAGDFILSNSMSFGKPYIIKTTGAIHDGWLVLREKNSDVINKDYLYNILSSPYVFNQFNELAVGSTVRNLNINLVSSVKIPVPPLKEQKRIVKKLIYFSKKTKKLASIYNQKLKSLNELKQSILQKAFKGELSEGST